MKPHSVPFLGPHRLKPATPSTTSITITSTTSLITGSRLTQPTVFSTLLPLRPYLLWSRYTLYDYDSHRLNNIIIPPLSHYFMIYSQSALSSPELLTHTRLTNTGTASSINISYYRTHTLTSTHHT